MSKLACRLLIFLHDVISGDLNAEKKLHKEEIPVTETAKLTLS